MGRVVIAGAGVAGLSTAVRLADFGHEVVVLERRSHPGGQLSGPGTGAATLTLPAVLRDLFGKTGRRLDREITLRPADPGIRYLTSRGAVALPHASRAGTLEAMRDAFGGDAAAEWDRLIRAAGDIWAITRPAMVERPLTARAVAILAMRPSTRRAVLGTLGELVARLGVSNPAVREMLAAHAVLTGADPVTGPAMLATGAYLHQTFGNWTVDGGPGALVDALARRAHERGVTLRTETAAVAFERRGRRITGVVTEHGERLPADVVVSTVPETEHHRLLGIGTPGRSRRQVRSVLTIMLDASQPGIGPSSRTSRTGSTGDQAIRTVVTRTATDPACVVQRHHDRGTVIHIDVDADGWQGTPWEALSDRAVGAVADDVLAGLMRRGLDVDGAATAPRIHTPADLASDLALGNGSPHGPPAISRWAAVRRPGARTGVGGLYRAGASVQPGPGIHATAMSAAMVADLVGRPTVTT